MHEDSMSTCFVQPFMEGNAMKSTKLNAVLAGLLGAGTLLSTTMISTASAGEGWDAFNAGDGEMVAVSAYMGTSLGAAGRGWDAFNAGDGESIAASDKAYMGTSLEAVPSGVYDPFDTGVSGSFY
jgi:hypothetical protein